MPTPYSQQSRMPTSTMWGVSKTCSSGITKPKRPYTPYNLFYLLERELVVQKINGPPKNISSKRLHLGMAPREEDHIKPSSRYNGIIMAPYWYDPNMKEKRKHRKTHGMISFKELTGIISANWAKVDKETKDYVTIISEIGRKRYKEEMNRFNASQKNNQLKKEQPDADSAKKLTPSIHNTLVSPAGHNMAFNRKPFPVTPDRAMLSPPMIRHNHSPSGHPYPHSYPHPNLSMMCLHRYGISQLPPPLPNNPNPPLPPPMPSTMPNQVPSPYQQRPRQFQNSRPIKTTKKDSVVKGSVVKHVTKTDTNTSSRHTMLSEGAANTNTLTDEDLMNFDPEPITHDVFEEKANDFVSTASENDEDKDILDMIQGDLWNLDMDFNIDEEPFQFLAD